MTIQMRFTGVLLLAGALAGCEVDHPVNLTGPSTIVHGITISTTMTVQKVTYPDTAAGTTRVQEFRVVVDTLFADDELHVDTKTDHVSDAFDVTDTCDLEKRSHSATPKRCEVIVTAFHPPANAVVGSTITRHITISRYEEHEEAETGEIVVSGKVSP